MNKQIKRMGAREGETCEAAPWAGVMHCLEEQLLILLRLWLLVVVVVVVVVPNGLLGGPWMKCMFFRKRCSRLCQKQVFKSTSMQKHMFKAEVQENKKKLSPRRDAPFRVYFYIIQTTLRSAAKVMYLKWIWILLWAFDRGHEQTHVMFVCV